MVASSGSFRVSWDGVVVAHHNEQHPEALLDRAAVELPMAAGEHMLTVKVCTGALEDEGRVRARFVDRRYRPVPVVSSSDPHRLHRVASGIARRATSEPPGVERAARELSDEAGGICAGA